jgi:hypothetical protein
MRLTDRDGERDVLDQLADAVRADESRSWWCAATRAWARRCC